MGGRTSERVNTKYYSLKSKAGAKDTETPHFALVEKKGDEYVTTAEYNEMFGKITGASIKVGKTSKGKEIKSFILLINDGTETSNLQLPYSNLSFSIVNALASLNDLAGDFTFYVDKAKKGDYWNARCFIRQYEDKVSWKYKYEEYPHPEPIMIDDPSNPGAKMHFETADGKQYDKTKMVAFWEKVFMEEIVPKVLKPTAQAAQAFLDEPDGHETPAEGDEPF